MTCGGVEAGGTKVICAVATEPDDVRAVTRIPTTTPAETLARVVTFFQDQPEPPAAVGIGSFGPVDPDPTSPTYGCITRTPKPGWEGTDVRGPIREALGVPVAFDSDVNAAAMGEYRWGAGRDTESFIYLTVGTGIGGGAVVKGHVLHGLVHPEMGHICVPRHPEDTFEGSCPFHEDCLEGMAAGPALEARWGTPGEELPANHSAWALEAHYLAMALVNYICVLSPERIVLGGGIMHREQLFPMIRRRVQERLNGYVDAQPLAEGVDAYIVPPDLGDRAGVLGAIALAQEAI